MDIIEGVMGLLVIVVVVVEEFGGEFFYIVDSIGQVDMWVDFIVQRMKYEEIGVL